jgi:hypothetical protein
MLEVRRSHQRGDDYHGWLQSTHRALFASYYDYQSVEFSALRVINEDRVRPGASFGTHGHQDMKIIRYVPVFRQGKRRLAAPASVAQRASFFCGKKLRLQAHIVQAT